MPIKENIPTQTDHIESARTPLAIVITGTMPRDEETLRLANFLNSESAAGNVEVFYFADADLSDPILTAVSKSDTRLVNPLRIPEDLEVTGSVEVKDRKDETGYYKSVAQLLRDQGREAVCLAYPSITTNAVVPISTKLTGTTDDFDYYRFDHGKQAIFNVSLFDQIALLDIEHTLQLVGPANVAQMHLLTGPTYTKPEVDHALTDEDMRRVLVGNFGNEFNQKYRDRLLAHLIERGSRSFKATSDFDPIDRAGIKHLLQENARKFTNDAIDAISNAIVADPQIVIAKETAQSILDEATQLAESTVQTAEESAQALLDKAREEASKVVESANATANEVLTGANENAAELWDGAIEASAIVPELAEMLKGPLASIASAQQTREQKQAEEQVAQALAKRVDVKEYCDVVAIGCETIETKPFSYFLGVLNLGKSRDRFYDWLKAGTNVFKERHEGLVGVDRIAEMVNETNLGIKTMSVEDAICAVATNHFHTTFENSESGQKILEKDDKEWEGLETDRWIFDDEQVDRALFQAMLSKAQVGEFNEADRLFISTCDHVLGGAISDSLSRSLSAHMMQDVYMEVATMDPTQKGTDTDSLITEVESIARSSRTSSNGGHLADTLREVTKAAERAQISEQIEVDQPLVMRSDGTTVPMPGSTAGFISSR